MTATHDPAVTPAETLVSVGIPAYNRPDSLRKVLESIVAQTHTNLQIIVSDDCSPNSAVRQVGEEFAARDRRITFHYQEKNLGMPRNFEFVLEQARAEYFMWAADDDVFVPEFIEKCLAELLADRQTAAVGMEINYCTAGKQYDFFTLASPFYAKVSEVPLERCVYMLEHYHGDMIYSLYRRDALYRGATPCTQLLPVTPIESPLFTFVTWRGHWKVLPEVGLIKAVDDKRYQRIKWFIQGGVLPHKHGVRSWRFSHFRRLPRYFGLNLFELRGIYAAIRSLDAPWAQKLRLYACATGVIAGYQFAHLVQRKSSRL